MTGLTLEPILHHAGIELSDALVIRHAYVEEHEDSGLRGIHADSTDAEILIYTNNQSASSRNFLPHRHASGWFSCERAAIEQVCGQ